jgi:hypothetical protein
MLHLNTIHEARQGILGRFPCTVPAYVGATHARWGEVGMRSAIPSVVPSGAVRHMGSKYHFTLQNISPYILLYIGPTRTIITRPLFV